MKKLILILIFFILFANISHAGANEISFSLNKEEVSIGEEFLLGVHVASSESINAVEGRVIFRKENVEFIELREGGSVINFWVEEPHLERDGSIFFSGITPQGFSGQNHLFTLVFNSKKSGSETFSFEDVRILKNDGEGTRLDTVKNIKVININKESEGSKKEIFIDDEPPEIFTPIIGKNEAIFEDKNFIVFSTVDKISGVDHFEIREGWFGKYQNATSPYLLTNQKLNKKIYIKAIDKKGNERIVVFDSKDSNAWYKNLLLFVIITVLYLIFIFRKKLWHLRKKFIK